MQWPPNEFLYSVIGHSDRQAYVFWFYVKNSIFEHPPPRFQVTAFLAPFGDP